MAEGRPSVLRQQGGHVGLDLRGVFVLREAHPAAEANEVRVGDDGGQAERRRTDHIGRLARDARQADELVHVSRHFAAEFL